MNNDIDHQEHEVDRAGSPLVDLLKEQLKDVLAQLKAKEEECSELIEFINHKNEHILELTQEIHHLKGTLL